jgi:hypothetical protein
MYDVLSPYWALSIKGVHIDEKRRSCITSLSIAENSDGSNVLTVVAKDPDLFFIEDDIFIEDAKIAATIGFNESTERVHFWGYISAVDITFPEDGSPEITLTCLDMTHLLNRTKKSRSWSNMTRPQVAKKIVAEYGYECEVESGYTFEKQDTITQSNQTDIEFLESLAGEETVPFLCKLIGNKFYYKKLGLLTNPVCTLAYRKFPYSILSFSPQITKEDIESSVTSSDVTTDTKEVDTSTVKNATETQGNEVSSSNSATGSTTGSQNIHYDRSSGKWIVS